MVFIMMAKESIFFGDQRWGQVRDKINRTANAYREFVQAVLQGYQEELYQFQYRTLDDYLEALGISRRHFNILAKSAKTKKQLESSGHRKRGSQVTNETDIVFLMDEVGSARWFHVPQSERHLHEISRAPAELQATVTVSAQVKAKTEGRRPTAKDYRTEVRKVAPPKPRGNCKPKPELLLASATEKSLATTPVDAPTGINVRGQSQITLGQSQQVLAS